MISFIKNCSENAELPIPNKYRFLAEKWKEISENAELPIPTKYVFLVEKWKEMSEFQPIIYNIWNASRINPTSNEW